MKLTKKQLRVHQTDFLEVIEASPKPKTAQELIIEIDELMRDAWRYNEDPENLSRTVLMLAIKNNGLGNHLAEVEELLGEAEDAYKYKVLKRKVELVEEGKSATVAEAKAELENFKYGQDYRQLKRSVGIYKLKRSSVDQAFDGGRSRLARIGTEMRQTV